MKIYRVSLDDLRGDGHRGYEYCPSKGAANKTIRAVAETCQCEIEIIDVPLTKAGVLNALNQYGGHPNNG